MTNKNRRQVIEALASHIDPATHRQHIEEQLKATTDQASRVLVSVQQLEGDPHAQEVEKAQLDRGYDQLESLLWRVEDLDARLKEMDSAHVASVAGLNRAQRRARDKDLKRRGLEDEPSDNLEDNTEEGNE
jgi:hypothetical protein